jgi:hypothetical protein
VRVVDERTDASELDISIGAWDAAGRQRWKMTRTFDRYARNWALLSKLAVMPRDDFSKRIKAAEQQRRDDVSGGEKLESDRSLGLWKPADGFFDPDRGWIWTVGSRKSVPSDFASLPADRLLVVVGTVIGADGVDLIDLEDGSHAEHLQVYLRKVRHVRNRGDLPQG